MKTKRTPLQWIGHLVGIIFFIILALVPAGIYSRIIWWVSPRHFWPFFWTFFLGGIVWLVVQVVWALCVGICWDHCHPPPSTYKEKGVANFDSQELGSQRIP